MKNIAKIAALSAVLSVGNIEAKNIERTDAMHCASTDLQNLAKNIIRTDAINRVSTTTADFTKSREKLNGNPPELATVLVQYDSLKDTPEELRKYLKENQITVEILKKWYDKLSKDYTASLQNLSDESSSIGGYNQGHAEKFKKDTDAKLEPYRKASEKISNQKQSVAVMIELLEIPTAEDFIGKPSTIDQKSREIVEWEKKYEMEIVDKDGKIRVFHNGEQVSVVVSLIRLEGKSIMALTQKGELVLTYVKKSNGQKKMIIYIAENGGMTQKSGSFNDQLYKFTKTHCGTKLKPKSREIFV